MHIGGVLDEERIIVLVFLGTMKKVGLDVAFNIVYVGDTTNLCLCRFHEAIDTSEMEGISYVVFVT